MNRYWLLILIAGLFEIAWVIGLKHADHWLAWTGTVAAIFISMDLLIRGAKKLPVGTAYAVFTGIGTAGTVIIEMAVFGEPFRLLKLLFILILLVGVVGLKTVTDHSKEKREET